MERISHYEDKPAFYVAAYIAHTVFSILSTTFELGLANKYASFITNEKLKPKNYL